MKKKILSAFLVLAALFSLVLAMGIAVSAGGGSLYYQSPVYNTADDPTSGLKEMETVKLDSQTQTIVTITDENKPTDWGGKDKKTTWYVVYGTTSVEYTQGITVTGDVRLILLDGCNLTVTGTENNAAINVSGTGNSLTIYAGNTASTIAGTGTLTANGGSYAAGIGGRYYESGSNIIINGGTVTSTGGETGAGIGGGARGNGSNIIINGGTVKAQGSYRGTGIGGGYSGSGSNIIINGGTVTSTGGETGAGIGGGYSGSGSNIYVAQTLVTKAGADENPTDVVENNGGDIASLLSNKQYVTIIKKLITVSDTTVDGKTYDGTTAVATNAIHLGTVSGIADGDDVTVEATAIFDDADAKNGRTVTITYTLSGDDAYKYAIPESTTTFADITKRSVILTSASASKTYDGTPLKNGTVAETGDGFVGEEGVIFTVTGSQTDAGTSLNMFTYTAKAGTNLNNYNITKYEGELKVDKCQLTVSDTTASDKTYDGTTDAAVTLNTVSGKITGDDVEVIAAGTFDNKDVGTDKNVSIEYSLSGSDANNYIAPANETVYASITPNQLYITQATPHDKTYNGTKSLNVTLGDVSGKITGDDVTVNASYAFNDWNAGTNKPVSVKYSLSGREADNYIAPASETVYADITPRQINVTDTTADSKMYDGTTAAKVNIGEISGILAFDEDYVIVEATGEFEDKNVGNGKKVTISYSLSGAEAGNYAAPSNSEAVADIDKRALTIDAEIADKIYDGTKDAEVTNVTFDSLAEGETFEFGTDYTVCAEFDNTDAAGANAATKVTVTVTLVSNEKTNNYTINSNTIEVPKTISKAEQTIASPTLSEKTSLTVTLNEIAEGIGATKYGVSTTDAEPTEWQDSTTFEGLTPGTAYYFFAKYEGNDNYAEVISDPTVIETLNAFTVTWMSCDGSRTLEIDEEVAYNSYPVYDGETPYRNSGFVYYYTFNGWSTSPNQKNGTDAKDLPTVTGDVTYYATFSREINSIAYLLPILFNTDNADTSDKDSGSSVESVHTFEDVAAADYYYDAVMWAYANGVTDGADDTHFYPDNACTRAQMVTFMWRAAGCPEPTATSCSFTDVDADDYFYKAVLWAVEKGITVGTTTTTFSPYDTCTRAQAVTFLYRQAGEPAVNAENIFTDVKADDYFCNAVLWAIEKEITVGTSSTTFSPYDLCTRAHIVTFIYRAGK